MSEENKNYEQQTLDILSNVETKESESKEKKPRDKHAPANNKKTDASASAFGWEFQIMSAVALSLKCIEEFKEVKVEGETEDIEIYFSDNSKDPEYIQAKALQNPEKNNYDRQKLVDGLNTLINTSNRTKGKYSKLLFICNYSNPFNLSIEEYKTNWLVSMDDIFQKSYKMLPESGERLVQSCMDKARKDLRNGGRDNSGYDDSIDFFYLDKLYFASNTFSDGDGEGNVKYRIIDNYIKSFLSQKCNHSIEFFQVDAIRNMLMTQYFNKATKPSKNKYKTITREELVWRIIITMLEVPADKELPIDRSLMALAKPYQNKFFEYQSTRTKNINKVILDYHYYKLENSIEDYDGDNFEEFIDENWNKYLNLISEYKSDKEREIGIRYILWIILYNKYVINIIKEGAGIE